jgi:hypothetical protein
MRREALALLDEKSIRHGVDVTWGTPSASTPKLVAVEAVQALVMVVDDGTDAVTIVVVVAAPPGLLVSASVAATSASRPATRVRWWGVIRRRTLDHRLFGGIA